MSSITQTAALQGNVKEISLEVTVTRADGTVEELGTVAYWHKNPLRRLAFRVLEVLR